MNRILVGVDGSEDAARALRWSAELATALGIEVVVVHVTSALAYPVSHWASGGFVTEDVLTDWRAELAQRLDGAWSAPARDAGASYRTLLVDGDPGPVLMAVADDEDAGLTVIGTRGRGGFAELLLGSVGHHLTHHARRPVIVVPPPGERHREPAPRG